MRRLKWTWPVEVTEPIQTNVTRPLRNLLRAYCPGFLWYLDGFHQLPDRRILIRVIFPYLRDDPQIRKILFVGCDFYTVAYKRFFRNQEYWTLEIDPAKRKYGAAKHIVAPLCDLQRHIAPGYFDAIICNGVFLLGAMEDWDEAEASFLACYNCLRSGGYFVLGWDDQPHMMPYPPEESEALAKFRPFVFPPLQTKRYLTADDQYRHVYDFYVKP